MNELAPYATQINYIFSLFFEADPKGVATISWMTSRQPELGGDTPVDALRQGRDDEVFVLARQTVARLTSL